MTSESRSRLERVGLQILHERGQGLTGTVFGEVDTLSDGPASLPAPHGDRLKARVEQSA